MAINVAGTLVPLYQNFNLRFTQAIRSLEAKKFASSIAMEMNSAAREEHYPLFDRAPGKLREWVAQRQKQGAKIFDYIVRNKKYEGTINIQREDIEDSQLGLAQIATDSLAYETAMWPEQLLTSVLESGGTLTTYDGQPFFSAAHPLGDGSATVQANLFNTASGTARPLSAANFAAVLQAGNQLKGADGTPIAGRGNPTLMVPSALEWTARTILQTGLVAPTAGVGGNAANAAVNNVLAGAADLIVNPWLTSSTAWYLFYMAGGFKPLIFQQRTAPEFTWMNQPNDTTVFWHDEVVYGVRVRGNAGLGLWYLAVKADA
jgi:phage major head subunit gpT-like protein